VDHSLKQINNLWETKLFEYFWKSILKSIKAWQVVNPYL